MGCSHSKRKEGPVKKKVGSVGTAVVKIRNSNELQVIETK